jgi:hypothetical protein
MPSRTSPPVARDSEDGKRLRKPGREEEKVYRTFPPHEPDVRFRAIYELPTLMNGRLCAKLITLERIKSFISVLNQVIEIDNEIQELQGHSHSLVQEAYQIHKTDPPRKDIYFVNQKFCLTRVVNAYQEVKLQIGQETDSAEVSDFLQAMLEIVGCIILNPGILAHCETSEEGPGFIGLRTNFFVSSWAANKVPRIFWRADESGIEAIIKDDGRWVGVPFNYRPTGVVSVPGTPSPNGPSAMLPNGIYKFGGSSLPAKTGGEG